MPRLREVWEKNGPEALAVLSGAMPRFVLGARPPDVGESVPVFCYHLVGADVFEDDLRFLERNGYVTLDADALADHMEGSRRAPARAVVLTIDDGARNLYEVAFPILVRHAMVAVAFVVPGLHGVEPSGGGEGDEPFRPLGWEELREMASSGAIDVQSHSFEHRYVPRWPEPVPLTGWSDDWVRSRRGEPLPLAEDLRRSKLTLEDRLGKPVRHLAFPKYQGTDEAVRLGRECGYRGFWWGALAAHRGNRPGQSPTRIFRLNDEWLRRLPGEGRRPLRDVLGARFGGSLARLKRTG